MRVWMYVVCEKERVRVEGGSEKYKGGGIEKLIKIESRKKQERNARICER